MNYILGRSKKTFFKIFLLSLFRPLHFGTKKTSAKYQLNRLTFDALEEGPKFNIGFNREKTRNFPKSLWRLKY